MGGRPPPRLLRLWSSPFSAGRYIQRTSGEDPFFGLLYWPKNAAKIPKVPGAPCNVNPRNPQAYLKLLLASANRFRLAGLVLNRVEDRMERKFLYGNGRCQNGMEYARMEWNGRFQEWNGRQSSILPYQSQLDFAHGIY